MTDPKKILELLYNLLTEEQRKIFKNEFKNMTDPKKILELLYNLLTEEQAKIFKNEFKKLVK